MLFFIFRSRKAGIVNTVDTGEQLIADFVDTCDKHSFANISPRIFEKNSKRPQENTHGPGGHWFTKKIWSRKSRVRLSLKGELFTFFYKYEKNMFCVFPVAFLQEKALRQFYYKQQLVKNSIVNSMPKLNDFHISCNVLLYFYINIYDFFAITSLSEVGAGSLALYMEVF